MAEEIIGLKVELDTSGASAPMASLKSQIKEATNELVTFTDKFGATSKEAINAAKRVAELKDRMGDARQMVDAFNPDAKFNALTQAISGAANAFTAVRGAMGLFGVESANTEKALLKVQSAMALSQGLSGFLDGGIEGFKNLYRQISGPIISAFTALKTAIGSTGIGLLVIAIAAIAANWDKITTAISGVSDEQRKLNALGKENLKKEEDKLKHLNSQDNVLKLQGKSERQILEYKIQQIASVIKATEQQIKSEIALNKAAVDAAVRNKAILISILDIVQYPIIKLLEGIDAIGSAFGKQFDLASGFKNLEANLFFDPEQIKKDGKATVDELNKTLDQLKNDQAGLKLSVIGIDDKAAEDAAKKEKDAQEKRKQLAKDAYNKQLEDLKLSLNEENKTFAERRKLVLENTKLTAEDRKKLNKEIDDDEKKYNEEHQKKLAEINKKYDAERLDREADTAVKKEELDYQRRLTEINSLVATTTEKNALIEKLDTEHLVRMAAAKKTDDEKALELIKKYNDEKANREADTYVKKEELDYQRRLAEINSLATSETQKQALIEKLDAEHKARMLEATKKDAAEAAAIRQEAINADIDSYMKSASAINSILSQSNANQLADLETNSQARIAAAGGNKEAILAIENETAIEKNRLQNEQVKRDKLFAIAEAIINTYKAAAQVFARPAPGDPVTSLGIKIASMVAAVASGIANVMAIRKVPLPSGGGGGGDVSGGSAPNSPMGTVFNTITKINKDSIDKINDKAVKAYVVETDINNGQKRIERILINTKFK